MLQRVSYLPTFYDLFFYDLLSLILLLMYYLFSVSLCLCVSVTFGQSEVRNCEGVASHTNVPRGTIQYLVVGVVGCSAQNNSDGSSNGSALKSTRSAAARMACRSVSLSLSRSGRRSLNKTAACQ